MVLLLFHGAGTRGKPLLSSPRAVRSPTIISILPAVHFGRPTGQRFPRSRLMHILTIHPITVYPSKPSLIGHTEACQLSSSWLDKGQQSTSIIFSLHVWGCILLPPRFEADIGSKLFAKGKEAPF